MQLEISVNAMMCEQIHASTLQAGDTRNPSGPHPLVNMNSSLTCASPIITRYPLMLQLGGLLPYSLHQVPI